MKNAKKYLILSLLFLSSAQVTRTENVESEEQISLSDVYYQDPRTPEQKMIAAIAGIDHILKQTEGVLEVPLHWNPNNLKDFWKDGGRGIDWHLVERGISTLLAVISGKGSWYPGASSFVGIFRKEFPQNPAIQEQLDVLSKKIDALDALIKGTNIPEYTNEEVPVWSAESEGKAKEAASQAMILLKEIRALYEDIVLKAGYQLPVPDEV